MTEQQDKTHYRKAFNSPYLSSADIVGPTVLTVARVTLEIDKTKKTKDFFNTAYFVEKELRKGEPLKPMILNAHNSRVMRDICGSHFIDDWSGPITVYVEHGIKFGRDTVEGLRISPQRPQLQRLELVPESAKAWANAIAAYKRDGNLDAVMARMYISEENQLLIIGQAADNDIP